MSNLIDAIRQYTPFGQGKKQASRNDTLIAEKEVAGPHSGSYVFQYMAVESLETLSNIARTSPVQRVQLDNVGLHIRRYQSPEGHVYEVWCLVTGQAKPERLPFIETIRGKE